MRTTDYIPEIRTRLDAAWNYIDDFKRGSDRFFASMPYRIVPEEELKGNSKVIRYRFMVLSEVPVNLRLPITNCVHELRAIFDNLIWGLSQVVGERPSCGIKFPVYLTQFPSATMPKARAFETWVKNNQRILSKFPAGAEQLIRSLQPFNMDKRGHTGTMHPVCILNGLANQDKHKMLLHIDGVHGWQIHIGHLQSTGPARIGPGQTLQHNSVLMEVTVSASDPTNNYQLQVATHIAFDKDGPALGFPVYELLIYAHNFVRDEVVANCEPFFPK